MAAKAKGRAGCHQATPNTSYHFIDYTLPPRGIKTAIVKVHRTDCFLRKRQSIRQGGLRND